MQFADEDDVKLAKGDYGGYSGNFVEFYWRTVVDPFLTNGGLRSIERMPRDEVERLVAAGATLEKDEFGRERLRAMAAGRPICRQVEYVRIMTPGDKFNIPDKPATEELRKRYAKQYAQFKLSAQPGGQPGTPLSALAGLDPSRVEELAYFNIRTVEQLAELHDGNLQKLGFGTAKERERARDFLSASKGYAPIAQLRGENETLKSEVGSLRQQMEKLSSALEDAKSRKSEKRTKEARAE